MKITIDDYFDLDKIIESGQTFRARKLDENLYRFISLDKILYISKIPDNATSDMVSSDIKDADSSNNSCRNATSASYEVSCDSNEWEGYWHNYFDLDRSYKDIPIYDDFTGKCYEVSKGIRILRQEPFEMLISFIISQRKSIPAIRTSIEEICIRFGTCKCTKKDEKLYLFPTPEQFLIDNDRLSECKLGYRLPYVQDAINKVNNEPSFLDEGFKMSDEDLLNHLITIKGVGVKVANCVALFAYNRVGLAPIDTWINKIIDTHYNGLSPFKKYGDVAGIIQQYMFFYALTHKDEF
ncbi:MAG: DNA-3-methyladenine glycosylase 2 family protein [Lachnospiraceae bacterium]|nr:DNA-3-methyladenine glycosylase 2 family protein [Lachnospiraceae bacterium]